MAFPLNTDEDGDTSTTPLKYVPLREVYSATAPCRNVAVSSTSSKSRNSDQKKKKKPLNWICYARGGNTKGLVEKRKLSVFDSLLLRQSRKLDVAEEDRVVNTMKRRIEEDDDDRDDSERFVKKNRKSNGVEVANSDSVYKKKWARLSFDGDPMSFVGLQCKVYWPLDDDWYSGSVVGYNSETDRHHVKYKDGDEEDLILSNERLKFFISSEEMERLKLTCSVCISDTDGIDMNEMVVLAASLENYSELNAGDIIWAKLSGHSTWPAIVLDDSVVGDRKGLRKVFGEKSVLVQFFGTHEFARVKMEQVVPFLRGLLTSYHLKRKRSDFSRGLEEAKMYLSKQKLPKRMLQLRKNNGCRTVSGDECSADSGDEDMRDEGIQENLDGVGSYQFEFGDLQVTSLGKIGKDSVCFHDGKFICPEGYTAVRKFPSTSDPSLFTSYTMKVLRDADTMGRPLFRVTCDNGEQFEGSTSSSCWVKIYRQLRKMQLQNSDASKAYGGYEKIIKSGPDMFGFSLPEISRRIQVASASTLSPKFSKITRRNQDVPIGYRPVHVKWKDLDKCNVCHMDEEYENNLFLQCAKCRMMVHSRCYGELEPINGKLWFCNLCRPGAPEFPPTCCLCPVTGGVMKSTTDGRWAHLACAIWIPETCLSDIKRMEPVDGLSRINKDRWKLLCSICGVPHGACIQESTCYVAYHPLCARAAGFCLELEDEDRLHLIPLDQYDDDQCIRLLSFCKRHRPPSNERPVADDRIGRTGCQLSNYIPPLNPSGCARSEPYNYVGRRGRKEPEALAAVSLKRSFVENRPHLVGGYSQHESLSEILSYKILGSPKLSLGLEKLTTSLCDDSESVFSVAQKYSHMRKTFRKRLSFGKSGIHGFGIFAKQTHEAGDMVIEYTGELVRAPIADRREHLIYNSLVGAGTYMFRIDDDRVIDATRAGSIAHLINHSCEPNCYSRVIPVDGVEHILIFAKRDIKQWEELTYDYRFLSSGEQLACYCGFPRCRGVVNDVDAEEQMATLIVSQSELTD